MPSGDAITHARPTDRAETLLLVEDDSEIRDMLARFLNRHGRVTIAAENAEAARSVLAEHKIDLVILDIAMPGENGLSLCRHIRQTLAIPVILLSAYSEEIDRIVGLEIGADDYVPKPFSPRELMARIDAVLRRTWAMPPKATTADPLLRFDRWTLNLATRELADQNGAMHQLKRREYMLLMALLKRPGSILTRDQLLETAFDDGAEHSLRAVDASASRLRRIIEVDARAPQLLKTILGIGYRLDVTVKGNS